MLHDVIIIKRNNAQEHHEWECNGPVTDLTD